jgi:hypothetical protein
LRDLTIGGWQGIISDLYKDDNGNLLVYIEWDSVTLENMSDIFIDKSEENGLDFSSMSLFDGDVELSKSIDTKEDMDKAIEKIHDEHMIFW